MQIHDPTDWSPFFKAWELDCPCTYADCPKHGMENEFMGRIMSLRKEYDRPMIVNSGYRCPKHNNNVSDTGFHGPHTMGVALDIRVAGSDQFDFVRLAINHGFRRFGMRQHGPWNLRFVHIDGLFGENYPRVFWTYN